MFNECGMTSRQAVGAGHVVCEEDSAQAASPAPILCQEEVAKLPQELQGHREGPLIPHCCCLPLHLSW